MKKVISKILILSFFLQAAGCYTLTTVPKHDYKGSSENIKVTTINSLQYFFNIGEYVVEDSSITGNGYQIIYDPYETRHPFKGNLPMSEIAYLEIERNDATSTIALTFGILAITAGILYYGFSLHDTFAGLWKRIIKKNTMSQT